VVLDGAWGTMLQGAGLTPADYRTERFADHPKDVAGDPDLLNITRPDVILDVHRQYLAAGADITTTNTFTATSIGQADYGLQDLVREMNLRGAQLARLAADEVGGRFVAGSIGPLNVTLSLSPRVEDPAYRAVSFDEVKAAYAEQIQALADGGVDLLLVETIFDTLNAKAAIAAAREVAPQLPLWISVTIVDLSGRTLSGQTVEAFWESIAHAEPLVVGVNCSLGAEEMRPHVADLARLAGTYTACHPNAGLPNAFGGYDQSPDEAGRLIGEFAAEGLVNIVGGCCGTSPAHIAKIAAAVAGTAPRPVPAPAARTRFSGLEPFEIGPDTGFVMIGERTNVTGSARFRRLIEADDYQGAVDVALEQVRGGANLLDVNMDADLLDSVQAMTTFLNLIATEPEVARLPIMIDSSRWSVLEAGLRCVQGKGVVNSISLKEGEASRPRTSSSTRTSSPWPPASASTTATPRPSSTPCRRSRSAAPGPGPAAASRTCRSPSAATTSCARRCTRHSCSTPGRSGSTWASSTPASSPSTRTSPPSCSNSSRTCCSTGARTPPTGSSASPRPSAAARPSARST
jgi:5-methyltetrahydrofolate--homocysteine methyltransferase